MTATNRFYGVSRAARAIQAKHASASAPDRDPPANPPAGVAAGSGLRFADHKAAAAARARHAAAVEAQRLADQKAAAARLRERQAASAKATQAAQAKEAAIARAAAAKRASAAKVAADRAAAARAAKLQADAKAAADRRVFEAQQARYVEAAAPILAALATSAGPVEPPAPDRGAIDAMWAKARSANRR
ncbi:hypothetical protein ACT009_11570 [Sphingomonas sp. Tas61C01]|uniref:hypothetical protein n=1 Tax=Sphingomonas sp. Tas61C01 TaxID=3458297 RepID=UPI00403ED664